MVPTSSNETIHYTPPVLAETEPKPVFRFRPVTAGMLRQFRAAMLDDGLTYWDPASIRAEAERAIRELWSDSDREIQEVRGVWATIDQAEDDPSVKVEPGLLTAHADWFDSLAGNWPPLRRMLRQNMEMTERGPLIVLSMFLTGWSGIDVKWERRGGMVPEETINEISSALSSIEGEHGLTPGVAYMQLGAEAMTLMSLTKEEAKNSGSPPSQPSDQNGLEMTQATPAAGKSKGSVSSRKTRRK